MYFYNYHSKHGDDAMKTWKKPVMTSVEAGFEISRYLPAEIGACKGKK